MDILGSIGKQYMFLLLVVLFLGFGLGTWAILKSLFGNEGTKGSVKATVNNKSVNVKNTSIDSKIIKIIGGTNMKNGWLKLGIFSLAGLVISFSILGFISSNNSYNMNMANGMYMNGTMNNQGTMNMNTNNKAMMNMNGQAAGMNMNGQANGNMNMNINGQAMNPSLDGNLQNQMYQMQMQLNQMQMQLQNMNSNNGQMQNSNSNMNNNSNSNSNSNGGGSMSSMPMM